MVRMDKLLDAWRADPGVEPTVELCAMLTRASHKPGAREAIPSAFIVAFGTEALLKHPKAPDVHIAVAILYESCGESRQAARLLDLAQKAIPDDPRVIELRKTLKVQRTTRELVSDMGSSRPVDPRMRATLGSERDPPRSSPPPSVRPPVLTPPPPRSAPPGPQDPETFDVPTTPFEPPTVTEVKATPEPARRAALAPPALRAPPKPPSDDDRDDPPTRTGNIQVPQRDSLIDATTTDTSQQETLNMPVMRPPAAKPAEPALHPRRSRTLLGGVSALVPPPASPAPPPAMTAAAATAETGEVRHRTHKNTITGRNSVDGLRQSVRPPPPAQEIDQNPKTATRVAPLIPPKESRPGPPSAPPSDPGGSDGPMTATRVGPPPGSSIDAAPTTDDSEAKTKAPVNVADLPRPDQDNPKTATRVAPVPVISRTAPAVDPKQKAVMRQTVTRAGGPSAMPPAPSSSPKSAPISSSRSAPISRPGAAGPPSDDGPSTGRTEARKVASKRGFGTDDPLMKGALERRARWQSTQAASVDDGGALDSPTRVGDADAARAAQAASARLSRPDPRVESTQTDVDDPPTRSMPPSAPPGAVTPPSEPKPARALLSTPPPPPPPPPEPPRRPSAAPASPSPVRRMPTEELSIAGAEVIEDAPAAQQPSTYAEQQRGPARVVATTEPLWRRPNAARLTATAHAPAPAPPSSEDDDDASTFSKALTNIWAQTGNMPPTPAEAERILRQGTRSPIAETTGDESVDTKLRPLAPLHPSARPPAATREDTGQSIVVDPSMIESLDDDDDAPSTYIMKPAEALAAARVDPRPVASVRGAALAERAPDPTHEAMLAASAGLPAFTPPPSLGLSMSGAPPPSFAGAPPMVQQGAMLHPRAAPSPSPSYGAPPPGASAPSYAPQAPYTSPPPPYGLQQEPSYDPSVSASGPYGASGSFAPSASSWPSDTSYASGHFPQPVQSPGYRPQQDLSSPSGGFQNVPAQGFVHPQDPSFQSMEIHDQPGGPTALAPPSQSRPVGLYLALGIAVVAVACLVGYAVYLLVTDKPQSAAPVDGERSAQGFVVSHPVGVSAENRRGPAWS